MVGNHKFVKKSADAYAKNEDGEVETFMVEDGNKKTHKGVKISNNDKDFKKPFSFSSMVNTDTHMSMESLSGKTNADGLKQYLNKSLIFEGTPEWDGVGCNCEVINKKIDNMKIYNTDKKIWEHAGLTNKPQFCCNVMVDKDGKCKRHNNPSTKNVRVWTGLGGDWASELVEL